MIDSFRGQYRFLSNYYFAPMKFQVHGIIYVAKSNEHYFQAHKATNRRDFEAVLNCNTGKQAKFTGRTIQCRADWYPIRDRIMYDGVVIKFTQNAGLKHSLIQTYPHELVEGNTWGDTYWGKCNGQGQNKLGLILMVVRNQLMNNLL